MMQTPDTSAQPAPSLGELARASAKIGLLGFGGPAGQLALMHDVFVEQKKWVSEDRYLFALSYCTLLPGPEAQQMATYLGWLLGGIRGALIAGLLFILPGAVAILVLSWLYVTSADLPLVSAALYGVRCVVLALIVQSIIKMSGKSLKPLWTKVVAVLSFLALLVLNLPFPLVILVAALVGLILHIRTRAVASFPESKGQATPLRDGAASPHSMTGSMYAAGIGLCAWLLPVIALSAFAGSPPLLAKIGQLFSALSLVTFGGAYAATAWITQQAVEVENWLSATQMIDGLALVQTIPGPLVLVNQYVGFVAGWQEGGLGLALAGGLLATWCTFAPSFVWIFAGAPFAEKLRSNRFVATALTGVNAAVVGVIASLAFSFGYTLLLGADGSVSGAPKMVSFDLTAVLISLVALALLMRTRLALPYVLGLGLAAGMVMGRG